MNSNPDCMYTVTTSLWTSNRKGKIGSLATYPSISINKRPMTTEEAKITQMAG